MNDLLNERKKTHGRYEDDAACAMALIDVLAVHGLRHLMATRQHALHMICFKIARIIAGDPNFKDHWDDIAGYATLVAQRCPQEKQ